MNTKENQMATELTKNETADDLEGVKTISFREQDYYCPYLKLVRQLNASERRQLRGGIEREGRILDPLTVSVRGDGRRVLLDGHNRLEMADEMGLPEDKVPLDLRTGMTREQEAKLAVQRNAERRQLTKDDIAKAKDRLTKQVERILKDRNGDISDRAVAEELGTTHKTVGKVRKKLEEVDTVPTREKRTGKDGKKQSAMKRMKGKLLAAPTANGKTKARTAGLRIAPTEDDSDDPSSQPHGDMSIAIARECLKSNTADVTDLYYALKAVVECAYGLERTGTALCAADADEVKALAADLEQAAVCYRRLAKQLTEK
jgi:hypothetical protein